MFPNPERHCILVAASNPFSLPTPVLLPKIKDDQFFGAEADCFVADVKIVAVMIKKVVTGEVSTEVDNYDDLSDILVKAGYAGSYKRRTGDAVDGCAMFWKANEFRLLEAESIEFKGFGLRDNVAQLSAFEMCKGESRRILIGNIHVLYNPSRGDVKLGQSAIYKFLSSSQLNILSYDRGELSGQRSCHPAQVLSVQRAMKSPFHLMNGLFGSCWTDEEVKVATGNAGCHLLVHPLKLASSYATVKVNSSLFRTLFF
ncbi:hypothetical protein CJ030_MR5G009698 [Morella rubra]|uniref:Uncharacterized protein n=1 Tax=Morella rubra TaxID=262757 RepID=A0A6A1VLB5_9ROSI|nr:hypothetical protein CJ030_MR5G009698 [Morella rubra]